EDLDVLAFLARDADRRFGAEARALAVERDARAAGGRAVVGLGVEGVVDVAARERPRGGLVVADLRAHIDRAGRSAGVVDLHAARIDGNDVARRHLVRTEEDADLRRKAMPPNEPPLPALEGAVGGIDAQDGVRIFGGELVAAVVVGARIDGAGAGLLAAAGIVAHPWELG